MAETPSPPPPGLGSCGQCQWAASVTCLTHRSHYY